MAVLWEHRYERKPGRWVFVPTEECKTRGEEIRGEVVKRWKRPPFYYHLQSGGHVAALQCHVKHKYFACLDIEDFFGSVSQTRVTRCLVPWFGFEEARNMARESTVRHPSDKNVTMLPYGFTQSPILASLALAKSAVGNKLIALAKEMAVSVYMDDIILSSDSESQVADARAALEHLAPPSRFKFNADKCQGPSTKVTVFNVKLEQGLLSISDERFDLFATALGDSPSEYVREGILSYVRSVNVTQADALGA